MDFHKLECFHQAEGLFHASAHREVIDTQMLDDSIGVNDEEASEPELSSLVHPQSRGERESTFYPLLALIPLITALIKCYHMLKTKFSVLGRTGAGRHGKQAERSSSQMGPKCQAGSKGHTEQRLLSLSVT